MKVFDDELMVEKLEGLHKKKKELELQIQKLLVEYEQVKDDIEMAETMIMYIKNRQDRKQELINNGRLD
jgi:hypothetical protein